MLVEKIKTLCSERKVAIWALETACGLSHGAISKWKESSPTVKNIKAVADYFGVTVDDLLKEE